MYIFVLSLCDKGKKILQKIKYLKKVMFFDMMKTGLNTEGRNSGNAETCARSGWSNEVVTCK